MLELLGIIFGGAARIGQHWLDLRDKDKERDHEARMFDLQAKLQDQRLAAEQHLRAMDLEGRRDAGELDALVTAIKGQSDEAKAAGGWVVKLSASVRPIVSYWLLAVYTASKVATLYLTMAAGVGLAVAVKAAYTEFDGALLGSVLSFWFADRSLRKTK